MRRVPVTLREPVNALSHWLGVVLALPLLAVLLGWAQSRSLWPFVVFGVSFALLFLSSALYHSSQGSARTLAWLRKFDHSASFLLIAGSSTPVAYFGLSVELRWRLLGLV